MERFERALELPVTAQELFAWHERPGAFQRLMPPWQTMELVKAAEGLHDGSKLVFRMKTGGVWMEWEALHKEYVAGRQFVDEQVRGPFKSWRHLHLVEEVEGGARLVDRVDYELPGGALGTWAGQAKAKRVLERLFAFRHERTRNDILAHRLGGARPMTGAIRGASGLVGQAWTAFLGGGGHTVLKMVRRKLDSGAALRADERAWDPSAGKVQEGALEGVDVVIHLAGANVGDGRWTPEKKREIRESRELGAKALVQAIRQTQKKPTALITASAVGYYGDGGAGRVDEASPAGTGFLAEVCQAWEESAMEVRAEGVRVAALRLGVVLTAKGGALAKMLPAYMAGAGGRMGSGTQYMSWVSLDDVLSAFLWAMVHPVDGAVNVVSANPVPQGEFAKVLGSVLGRPAVVRTPASAVRLLFGEMGESLLLSGVRVRPGVLQQGGLEPLFPDVESALRFELGR